MCLLNSARANVRVRRSRIFPPGSSSATVQGSCTHREYEAVQCLHECQLHFGRVAIWRCNNYFKFLDYKKNLKIGMSSVGKMYVVCANFKERLKFLIWQPDCRIFSTRATHFRGILCLNISCFHSPLMTLWNSKV